MDCETLDCVRHLSDCSLVSRIITCTLLVNLFCSFERDLAAEALRVNENDVQKALDLLTNPERNCALQVLGFLQSAFLLLFSLTNDLLTSRVDLKRGGSWEYRVHQVQTLRN